MALARTSRGAGSTNTGGQSTLAISPASNCGNGIGTMLFLMLAYDNSGASGIDPITAAFANTGASVVDSVGNTWTPVDGTNNTAGVANDGLVLRTYICYPKFPITTSDTITVSFNGVTTVARAWTLTEVTCAAGKYVANVAGSGASAQGSSTTPSVVSVSPANADIVMACMGAQGNASITADSDTLNGSWSTQQTSGVGVTTAGMEIASQDKIVNATGAQTYNLTITSAKWISFTRNYRETTLPTYLTRTPGPLFIPSQRASIW